jgi:hypothetical protein
MRGKSYDYIVVCKSPSFKMVDAISQLMLLLGLVVFVSSCFSDLPSHQRVKLYVVIGVVITWLIRNYFLLRKKEIAAYFIGLLIAAYGWSLVPGWQWLTIVYILAAFLEKNVKFPIEYAFDEEEIVLNSLPKKHYYWNEINNILIKDGILTIDLKNNRLIQKEIENPGSDKAERDFNEFCRERLLTEKANRRETAI